MSDYYYNEKKGRYEPVTEAPFGIKPREKQSKKVFTAENYKKETTERFSSHYADEDEDTRFRPMTSSVEKVVNSLADALGEAADSASRRSSGTGTYSGGRTSSYGGGKKTTAPKSKFGLGMFVFISWVVFMAIRSCAE